MPEMSQFKHYSVGVAAENASLTSDLLEVYCQEDHPMADGEISDNSTTVTASGTSKEETPYQVKVDSTISIKCKWLPLGDANRQTPPNVRRGEKVIVYRYGNTEDYYWAPLGSDLKTRKLETVIHAYSGTSDENAEVSGDNTYFSEISTHKGLIRFVTSKANGEPFRYNVELNTKEGVLKIQDDVGNVLLLDSGEKAFHYENSTGSIFQVVGDSMSIDIPNEITVKTNKYSLEAKEILMKATNTTIESETLHKGNLQLEGSLAAGGGSSRSYNATFSYPVNFTKSVDISQTLNVSKETTVKKLISAEPIVAPNV